MTDPALTPEEEAWVRDIAHQPFTPYPRLFRRLLATLDAARKDEPGLREAAQRLVAAYEEFEGSHWHEEEQAYLALRAALATPPTDAGLDVERLARAWHAYHRHGLDSDFGKSDREAAAELAREYGASE